MSVPATGLFTRFAPGEHEREPMTSHRKDVPPGSGEDSGQKDPKKDPKHRRLTRRQRVLARAASPDAVAIAAFVTAFAGNFGDHAATLASAIGARSGPASASAGDPVTIDYAQPEQPAGSAVIAAAAKPIILTASQLSQLNSAQASGSAAGWLAARGALSSGTDILVVVQGNRSHTVRIVDIQPVASCAQPLDGTVFYSPSAASDPTTQLYLNLDQPQVPLSYAESYSINGIGEDRVIGDYFGHYTIPLSPGGQFTLAIEASTQQHYCKFTLAMTVVDGTRTVVEPITDHGKPFQVTAILGGGVNTSFSRYAMVYLGGLAAVNQKTGSWSRVNPATADQTLIKECSGCGSD
jgi:hypothetical protein